MCMGYSAYSESSNAADEAVHSNTQRSLCTAINRRCARSQSLRSERTCQIHGLCQRSGTCHRILQMGNLYDLWGRRDLAEEFQIKPYTSEITIKPSFSDLEITVYIGNLSQSLHGSPHYDYFASAPATTSGLRFLALAVAGNSRLWSRPLSRGTSESRKTFGAQIGNDLETSSCPIPPTRHEYEDDHKLRHTFHYTKCRPKNKTTILTPYTA